MNQFHLQKSIPPPQVGTAHKSVPSPQVSSNFTNCTHFHVFSPTTRYHIHQLARPPPEGVTSTRRHYLHQMDSPPCVFINHQLAPPALPSTTCTSWYHLYLLAPLLPVDTTSTSWYHLHKLASLPKLLSPPQVHTTSTSWYHLYKLV